MQIEPIKFELPDGAGFTEITPILLPQDYNNPNSSTNSPLILKDYGIVEDTAFVNGCYIECSLVDQFTYNPIPNNWIILENNDFTYTEDPSTGLINNISLDPLNNTQLITGLEDAPGAFQPTKIIRYNFLRNRIGNYLSTLFISKISSDRTELELSSFSLSYNDLTTLTNNFQFDRESSELFIEFYLNFGDNNLILGVNVKLTDDVQNPKVAVKLRDPLPSQFDIQSQLWIVTSFNNETYYKVETTVIPEVEQDFRYIQGPNFNIDLKNQINNSTGLMSYVDLTTTTLTSSQDHLDSLLTQKELNINVDYSNFTNFIHFSSAETRIKNFISKISLLESYSSSLSILTTTSPSNNMSSSKAIFEGKTSNIIKNFDGYEKFLYFESGSSSYPKSNNQIPYKLSKLGSTEVINWLGNGDFDSPLYSGLYSTASAYDNNNRNQLLKAIPEYLREDSNNQLYELFVDMVAQYYDNIWIYIKDVTNKYNNDNRLNFGISKDLVADAIRDFGIKLYQNNFSNNDLFTAFLGLTPDGSLFPYPNMTGSLPTPNGFEYVDTLISASNDILPQEDVNKSLYKRIYHNLPYLLNSKGTIPGLRALITSYGIPDTILRINEYGGKDKINVNDWDHWQNEFNYSFHTSESNFISSSWELNSAWSSQDNTPETLMFRFKTDGLPTTGSDHHSQSVWFGDGNTGIVLQYTGSGYTSGSYSGSIKDPYYQYAYLEFYPDLNNSSNTASVYLPFFDGDWWSVMVTRQDTGASSSYNLYSGNKIYEGGDNNTLIGFFDSSSIDGIDSPWINTTSSYFPVSFSVQAPWGYDIVTYDDTAIYDGTSGGSGSYSPISGSFQEIRYYSTRISESVFKDYVMNPYSIEGNNINSSPNELAFRAPVGGELYTGSISVHPKVTGSWVATHSFASSSNFYYDSTPNFVVNKEFFFVDQPVAGIKNVIGDKIRVEDNIFPGGYPTSSVLSPFKSILQQTNPSQSYTPNLNYLEVAFSPQNQINEDIMSQLGFFNIGDYIGDPRLRSSSADSYPALNKLRDEYFQKYIKNYDLKDFIRLIKFFDNSLFKMIKDFVPARTSLASGLIIKQHLLERDKYPTPQPNINTTLAKYAKSGSIIYNQPIQQQNIIITGSVKPQHKGYNSGPIIDAKGGTGGVLEDFNGLSTSPVGTKGLGPDNKYFLTQSWNETVFPPTSQSITRTISNQDEFYNGEFSGSNLVATTQSLAQPYPIVLTDLNYSTILYKNSLYDLNVTSSFVQSRFLNLDVTPSTGEILIQAPFSSEVFSAQFPRGITITSTPRLKIHKDDCDGENNRVVLGNATQLKIQNTGSATYKSYNLSNKTEHSTYFQFDLKQADVNVNDTTIYSEIKNYFISSSITSSNNLPASFMGTPLDFWSTGSGNISHYGTPYFNTSSGYLTFGDTPNIPLEFSSSVTTVGSGGGFNTFAFFRIRNGNSTMLSFDIATNAGTKTLNVSGSLTGSNIPIKNDQYYLTITQGITAPLTCSSAQFLLTQSTTPVAEQCVPVFFEPYVTQNNYYNSNFNPTINNIMDSRLNTFYQDVDYSLGVKPVNFAQLITGSATKFPIPDSHYTQKSSIIPRYLGAKSTSQYLNTWTEPYTLPPGLYSDIGTYGKSATIETPTTVLIYADWIGGYPPERMDASGIHVQYIINQDGTIIIPNTNPTSLPSVQEAFMSNHRLILNSNTVGNGDENKFRNIIRGGYRIEPILYTQKGHSPANWNNVTMSFSGSYVSDNFVGDFAAYSTPTASRPFINDATYGILEFVDCVDSGSNAEEWGASRYVITQSIIDQNVSLNVDARVSAFMGHTALGAQKHYITVDLIHSSSTGQRVLDTQTRISEWSRYSGGSVGSFGSFVPGGGWRGGELYFHSIIPPQDIEAGDQILLRGKHLTSTYGPSTGTTPIVPGGPLVPNHDVQFHGHLSYININQIPQSDGLFTTSSGVNTIWDYPNNTKLDIINCIDTDLNRVYNTGVTQNPISGSGFNNVNIPYSIKIGDEFRFEGNEINTFMVKKIYNRTEFDSQRLTNTGSIEVHFDKPLPSSSINLDHFVIRRYIPDASQIIMEGYKPEGSVGPYIVKPEYVGSELNKGIDDYILDLTNKGLI